MSRYAARGQKVLFIENTGVRSPRLSDGPRLWRRLKNWGKGWSGIREELPGLFVFSPVVLPFPNSPLAVRCNSWLLLRGIRRWMKTLAIRETFFFTWLPTGLARRIVDEIDPLVSVYFCCDNFAVRSSQPARIEAAEKNLLAKTDLVLAHGIKIRERLAKLHPRVELMQYGISASLFGKATPSGTGGRNKPGSPLVYGYVGGLHEHVDQDLLVTLARQHRDVEIRLIGPEQCDVSRLRAEPNIRLLGQKPHRQLPSLMRSFDAGLIPYLQNSYTETVFPTKLTEYLGCGLPVISTALPEVKAFSARFPGAVVCARTATEFLQALIPERIRKGRTEAGKRKQVAWQNTWERKIDVLDRWMAESLRSRRLSARRPRWAPPARVHGWAGRWWKPAAAAALLVLFLGTRLFWLGADQLLVPPGPPAKSDAVVAIGGGAGETGAAGTGYVERASRAAGVVRERKASRLLILSGGTVYLDEGRLMRGVALEEGIPADAILLDNGGGGTRGMLRRAVDLARKEKWKDVILVTSPYHAGRAVRVWGKMAPDIRIRVEPQAISSFYGYQPETPWWKRAGPSWGQIRGIFQEAVTRLYYRLQGWI